MFNKTLGSMLIVAGTSIGAGMLALPITTLELGFFPSLALLMGVWGYMAFAALMTIRMTLCFPRGTMLGTMVQKTLGPTGTLITTIANIWLFYALLAAYISGATSFLEPYLPLPEQMVAALFIVVFGGIILWRTSAVDALNRLFFIAKFISLALVIILAVHHIELPKLTHVTSTLGANFWIILPVLVTSFGFHVCIPTLVDYVGPNWPKLRLIVLIGSALPLAVYVAWETITLGILAPSLSQSLTVTSLIGHLESALQVSWIKHALDIFAQVGMMTSFFGVGLGLCRYFEDLVKKKPQPKVWAGSLTFIPPVLMAIMFPSIFVKALGVASIALLITTIFIPALVIKKLKCRKQSEVMPISSISLVIMSVIALSIIIMEVIHLFS